MSQDQPTSPLERLLNLGVYAPVGFLLDPDKTVAELADAGRKQLAFTRSLGQAALKSVARGLAPNAETAAAPSTSPEPVPSYDTMTAREIIELTKTCSDAQASWMRAQESSGKKRVTVLRALDARSASTS